VHGKGSLRRRMPGDDWQGFANLRALLAYQWTFPGKKLLFMGGEFGQSHEWNANGELDWALLDAGPFHRGVHQFVADLNQFYRGEPALWEQDYDMEGFFWIDCSDTENSVLSFVRQSADLRNRLLVALNLTPVLRTGYRLGVPAGGFWREVLNSDSGTYGGGNHGNLGGIHAEPWRSHGQPFSASLALPPLSAVVFKHEGEAR